MYYEPTLQLIQLHSFHMVKMTQLIQLHAFILGGPVPRGTRRPPQNKSMQLNQLHHFHHVKTMQLNQLHNFRRHARAKRTNERTKTRVQRENQNKEDLKSA